jgi:hypothetical protein
MASLQLAGLRVPRPDCELRQSSGFRKMGFGKSSTPNAYRFTFHELAVDTAALLDAALAA